MHRSVHVAWISGRSVFFSSLLTSTCSGFRSISKLCPAGEKLSKFGSTTRRIFLSKKIIKERIKELSVHEKRLFAKEVAEAKAKELASWVENGAFETIDKSEAPIRPQTGRWVLTWKLT